MSSQAKSSPKKESDATQFRPNRTDGDVVSSPLQHPKQTSLHRDPSQAESASSSKVPKQEESPGANDASPLTSLSNPTQEASAPAVIPPHEFLSPRPNPRNFDYGAAPTPPPPVLRPTVDRATTPPPHHHVHQSSMESSPCHHVDHLFDRELYHTPVSPPMAEFLSIDAPNNERSYAIQSPPRLYHRMGIMRPSRGTAVSVEAFMDGGSAYQHYHHRMVPWEHTFHTPSPTHHSALPPFLPELPSHNPPTPPQEDLDKKKKSKPTPRPYHSLSVNIDETAPPKVQEAIRVMDSYVLSDKYEDEETPVPPEYELVQEDEKPMLTIYQFHLMKQLRHCRFTEEDRKTKGGKRRNMKIGFGGLACVHCAPFHHARRFFWKECSQLTNSFSEISTHIHKCRALPPEQKSALNTLKGYHKVQMKKKDVAHGSRTVYFRNLWRRVHQDDDELHQNDIPLDSSSRPTNPDNRNPPSLCRLLQDEEEEHPLEFDDHPLEAFMEPELGRSSSPMSWDKVQPTVDNHGWDKVQPTVDDHGSILRTVSQGEESVAAAAVAASHHHEERLSPHIFYQSMNSWPTSTPWDDSSSTIMDESQPSQRCKRFSRNGGDGDSLYSSASRKRQKSPPPGASKDPLTELAGVSRRMSVDQDESSSSQCSCCCRCRVKFLEV